MGRIIAKLRCLVVNLDTMVLFSCFLVSKGAFKTDINLLWLSVSLCSKSEKFVVT
jgi:hypothetical protein